MGVDASLVRFKYPAAPKKKKKKKKKKLYNRFFEIVF